MSSTPSSNGSTSLANVRTRDFEPCAASSSAVPPGGVARDGRLGNERLLDALLPSLRPAESRSSIDDSATRRCGSRDARRSAARSRVRCEQAAPACVARRPRRHASRGRRSRGAVAASAVEPPPGASDDAADESASALELHGARARRARRSRRLVARAPRTSWLRASSSRTRATRSARAACSAAAMP